MFTRLCLFVSCAFLAVVAPASAQLTFDQVDYPVGPYGVVGITTGDFDGDGITDLASVRTTGNSVAIMLGNGDGTFGLPSDFAAGGGLASVISADFNRDGVPDLAATKVASNDLSVLLGNGDGTFGSPAGYVTADGTFSVTSADFNGDGILDLATGNSRADQLSVILGEGDGTFGPPALFGNVVGGYGIVAHDFNGDGVPDLAASGAGVVAVLLNSPTAGLSSASLTFGSTASPVPLGTASAPQTVTVTNDGLAPLKVSGFEIAGRDPDDFDMGGQTCGSPVVPGGSCQVQVRFLPHAVGDRQADLEILSNTATARVVLSGVAGPLPGRRAAIAKLKVNGPGKARKGKALKFKAFVSNSGNAKATGVRLNVTGKGVRLRKSVGNIAAGATKAVVLKVKPKRPGKVKVTFAAKSDNAGGRTVSKTIRVTPRR